MRIHDLVKADRVGKILSAFPRTTFGFPAYQIAVEKMLDRDEACAYAQGTGPLTADECRKIAEAYLLAADFVDVLNKQDGSRQKRRQFYAAGAR